MVERGSETNSQQIVRTKAYKKADEQICVLLRPYPMEQIVLLCSMSLYPFQSKPWGLKAKHKWQVLGAGATDALEGKRHPEQSAFLKMSLHVFIPSFPWRESVCVCDTEHVQRSEDNMKESDLTFYHVGPGN